MPDDVARLTVDERSRILASLKARLAPEIYRAWCSSLQFERTSEEAICILAPNPFYRDWLEKLLKTPLEESLLELWGRVHQVSVRVDAVAAAPTATPHRPETTSPPLPPDLNVSPEGAAVRPSSPGKDGSAAQGGPRSSEWRDRSKVRGKGTPDRQEGSAPARRLAGGESGGASGLSYAEANFTRLPFSLVNDKQIRIAKEILIDVTLRSASSGMARKRWRVTPGGSGMPGPFDHGVFRAIERYALDTTIRRGVPLQGPVFFHLKTIIEMLGLYYNSKNIRFISNAFDRLQELSIEDVDFMRRAGGRSGDSKDPAGKKRGRGSRGKIHLVDRIKAAGEMVRDGASVAVSGTYAVTFGREYEDSVNNGYVRPLDWDLWLGLARPISRRLVEILDMDFYGLRHGPHVAYDYSEICQLVPLKPQRFLSLARVVLDAAHEELVAKKYLTYQWDTENRKFWRVLYKPGPRWFGFQEQLGHRVQVTAQARDLALELEEPKRAAFYQQILDRVKPDYLNEALQDLRASVQTGRAPENKAAWFLGALKTILSEKGINLFPLV